MAKNDSQRKKKNKPKKTLVPKIFNVLFCSKIINMAKAVFTQADINDGIVISKKTSTAASGLYYTSLKIVIYDCNDSTIVEPLL
jgi:hypothetical protein